MKRKTIHDPLAVLAANTPLGQDADRQFLPFLVHLEEIRQGHGNQDNYDVCSVYLQAMLSTVASARHQQLLVADYRRVQCMAGSRRQAHEAIHGSHAADRRPDEGDQQGGEVLPDGHAAGQAGHMGFRRSTWAASAGA